MQGSLLMLGVKTAKAAKPDKFVSKRGRPTQTQVAAIDNTIIANACQLFLDNGYANTAMESVASSAGVSKGTLYARYPTKADLFKAIVADRLADWGKTSPQLGARADDVADILHRYGILLLAELRKPEVAAFDRLIVAEASRFPEIAQEFHWQGHQLAIESLAEMIRQAGEATGARLCDAQSIAATFLTTILGWYRNETLLREITSEDCVVFVGRAVEIFVGGRPSW